MINKDYKQIERWNSREKKRQQLIEEKHEKKLFDEMRREKAEAQQALEKGGSNA